jgi:hypothetical protein
MTRPSDAGSGPEPTRLADWVAARRRDAERFRAEAERVRSEWQRAALEQKARWEEQGAPREQGTAWASRVEPMVTEAERRARQMAGGVRGWRDARAYASSERRLRAAPARISRRANLETGAWGALAVASPLVAVAGGPWEWFVVAGGAALRGGLAWREGRRASRLALALTLPEPSVPAPRSSRGRSSASAGPMRRCDAALRALTAMTRSVPAGPAHDSLRAAMVPAVEVVDGRRLQAGRVIAVETARDAVADRARRAEIGATLKSLLAEMDAAITALEAMIAAASDVVAALPSGVADDRLHLLGWRTDALRGFADGLRAAAASAYPGAGPGPRRA